MKVFLSWSGPVSQAVALALRDWLPSVIQLIDPYVSSEDIDKGARWSSEIAAELESSDFGILCITPDNTEAPWLTFEAGALSKSIDKSRVVPFLFGLERAELPQGPLVQFQGVLADKEDAKKLVISLNAACEEHRLEEPRLESVFDVWWPELEKALADIDPRPPGGATGSRRSTQDLLTEVLELVRRQQQVLNDPTSLLPADYLRQVTRGRSDIPRGATIALEEAWTELQRALLQPEVPSDVNEAVARLERPIQFIIAGGARSAAIYRGARRVAPPRDDAGDEAAGDRA